MSGSTVSERVHLALRGLSPGYFASVMATGICSIGFDQHGFPTLSLVLLVTAEVGFVALIALNAWRLIAYREEMVEDFTHPLRGFGFYTFVAAANVLSVRIADDHHDVALWLTLVSTVLWFLRGYVVPWTTELGPGERPIVAAANGSWFMWAVSGQSVAVAAAVLAPYWSGHLLALLAVFMWGLGLFLYVVDGVFVAMRMLAHPFHARDLTPSYWVAMGAAAITALAGTEASHMAPGPYADIARDTIRAGALLAWVVATWLLPALCAAGWWRHVTHRVPLRYEVGVWSIVFPLGMYATATTAIARADHLPHLETIGLVGVWVAGAAWLLTSLAGARHVVRNVLIG